MPNIQRTYTAGSYTWVAPRGVSYVTVECWGGGSGGNYGINNQTGAGGGGGGYAKSQIYVIPGNSYSLTVAAGTSGYTNQGNPSWFGSTSTVIAYGGQTAIASGRGGSGIGDLVYQGGWGVYASSTTGGGGGGGAGSTGNGKNASGSTGGGSTSLNGGSGGAGRTSDGVGGNGGAYGGGGGAGRSTSSTLRDGGNGAPGLIILTYVTKFADYSYIIY